MFILNQNRKRENISTSLYHFPQGLFSESKTLMRIWASSSLLKMKALHFQPTWFTILPVKLRKIFSVLFI